MDPGMQIDEFFMSSELCHKDAMGSGCASFTLSLPPGEILGPSLRHPQTLKARALKAVKQACPDSQTVPDPKPETGMNQSTSFGTPRPQGQRGS